VLGVRSGLAGDHGAGGAVGVETVALALFAALCGAGAVDLDHLDTGAAQGGGDPDAVAGGALDADRGDRSVFGQPGDGFAVADGGGVELVVGDLQPSSRDHGDVDGVLVGVDPGDVVAGVCHDGHGLFLIVGMGQVAAASVRQDIHRTRDQARIRSWPGGRHPGLGEPD